MSGETCRSRKQVFDEHGDGQGPKFPFPQSSSPQDRWLCTPTGWTSVPEAYQLPESSQYGLLQLPYPQFSWLSTTGDTSPSASVGFRAQLEFREPCFTEVDSASDTLERRLDLAHLPVRPLLSPRLSHQRSGTVQSALSRAPGCVEPPTRIPSL